MHLGGLHRGTLCSVHEHFDIGCHQSFPLTRDSIPTETKVWFVTSKTVRGLDASRSTLRQPLLSRLLARLALQASRLRHTRRRCKSKDRSAWVYWSFSRLLISHSHSVLGKIANPETRVRLRKPCLPGSTCDCVREAEEVLVAFRQPELCRRHNRGLMQNPHGRASAGTQ